MEVIQLNRTPMESFFEKHCDKINRLIEYKCLPDFKSEHTEMMIDILRHLLPMDTYYEDQKERETIILEMMEQVELLIRKNKVMYRHRIHSCNCLNCVMEI